MESRAGGADYATRRVAIGHPDSRLKSLDDVHLSNDRTFVFIFNMHKGERNIVQETKQLKIFSEKNNLKCFLLIILLNRNRHRY